MTSHSLRDLACRVVEDACRLCTTISADMQTTDTHVKDDCSPVTIADFGVQALIARKLLHAAPHMALVGEENADALRTSSAAHMASRICTYLTASGDDAWNTAMLCDMIDHGAGTPTPDAPFWTLDPIDGTKGFLRGDQYAIALALIDKGEIVLGVLGCPHLPYDSAQPEGTRGCLFIAEKGGGTLMRACATGEERSVHVDAVTDPTQITFCESVESAHTAHSQSARVATHLGVIQPPFRIDSQCKYAAVARGDASVYLRLPTRPGYQEKIWDHAAGVCVIQEAGGRVTDITGAPLDFTCGRTLARNKGVVVTNGSVHDAVITAIKTTQEDTHET